MNIVKVEMILFIYSLVHNGTPSVDDL